MITDVNCCHSNGLDAFQESCAEFTSGTWESQGLSKRNMKPWSVYLLKCADGSLYCGVTTDMAARLKTHNTGRASKYTASRLPVELAAQKQGLTRRQALKLEFKIKKLPANKKIACLQES